MIILVLGFQFLLSDLNANDTLKLLPEILVNARFGKLKAKTLENYLVCNATTSDPIEKEKCANKFVKDLDKLDKVNNMALDYVNSAPPVSVLLKMLMCNNSNMGVSPFWKVNPIPACNSENK